MIAKREVLRANLRDQAEQRSSSGIKALHAYAPGNASEALLLLGVATLDERWTSTERQRLLLEPWAVQLALDHRRGAARVAEQDIDFIKRDTRDPETARWRKGTDR